MAWTMPRSLWIVRNMGLRVTTSMLLPLLCRPNMPSTISMLTPKPTTRMLVNGRPFTTPTRPSQYAILATWKSNMETPKPFPFIRQLLGLHCFTVN
jgi:hypothetical protein